MPDAKVKKALFTTQVSVTLQRLFKIEHFKLKRYSKGDLELEKLILFTL